MTSFGPNFGGSFYVLNFQKSYCLPVPSNFMTLFSAKNGSFLELMVVFVCGISGRNFSENILGKKYL
jgi:hypothetical protein